jgi:hypothetical protein
MGGGWSTPRPGPFIPGKENGTFFCRRLDGPQGPSWEFWALKQSLREVHGHFYKTATNKLFSNKAVSSLIWSIPLCYIKCYSKSVYKHNSIVVFIDGFRITCFFFAFSEATNSPELWAVFSQCKNIHLLQWASGPYVLVGPYALHMLLGKWLTWCTNYFLCIYFYL